MHGTNAIRPYEKRRADGKLQVQDIWYTMQGEGPFAGCPAVFIRLTGCNLACHFCDTVWDDVNDRYMSLDEIITLVVMTALQNVNEEYGNPPRLVVLTGGEPARQDVMDLIYALKEEGFHTQIETAGTYWQSVFENTSVVTVVVSPKTAHLHPKVYEHVKHWKYVIEKGKTLSKDGLPGVETQLGGLDRYGIPARPHRQKDLTVWLSPCDTGDPITTQANVEEVGRLCLAYGYRAQMQLHKYMKLP